MKRSRVTTTWNPELDPELEDYFIAHSDNCSAAARRALKAGILAMELDPAEAFEEIKKRLTLIEKAISGLGDVEIVYIPQETEIEPESLPSDVLSNLRGLAGK